ncbi:MAG: hypothetical protein NVS2B15_17000 [Pseudarthrobacter sp.]
MVFSLGWNKFSNLPDGQPGRLLAKIGDDVLCLLVSAERSEVDGHYGSCAGDGADLNLSASCCSDA